MKQLAVLIIMVSTLFGCNSKQTTKKITSTKHERQYPEVKKSNTIMQIDGKANEAIWKSSTWYPLDQLWLGEAYTESDFYGRYKLTWTNQALYLLAEITDDILLDQEKNPLKAWWDDDCLEIFIDEDHSGGNHQFTHNAFAYHLALDGNVVDMSTSEKGKLYNSHIQYQIKTEGNTSIWEVKIGLYKDNYIDDGKNSTVKLNAGKKIGFALAYCDNDTSENRENFIGSIAVEGEDKNRGWIDADIFGTLVLIK